MIEFLEIRQLFSKIPLLLYPAPTSVVNDANSIINSTPTEVLASAAGHVAAGQAPSQAMLNVIENHEGYSLSIYPDASGVPTVGVGIRLDSNDEGFATAALSAAGVGYSALVQDWNNIKSLFVHQHHPLKALKDTSQQWATFVAQNPSVADDVLTASQATSAFEEAGTAKLTAAAAFFGSQFYDLDRDPQIALVDLAYHVADFPKYKTLTSQIQGNSQNATNYVLAAKQLQPGRLGSIQRALDDQTLMKHGENASSIAIPADATVLVGQNASLPVTASGAFGKSIILMKGELSYAATVAHVVTYKVIQSRIEIVGYLQGTTDLTVTERSTSTAATVAITATGPACQVRWQAVGTRPNVDGTQMVSGQVYSHVPESIPNPPFFNVLATAPGSKRDQHPKSFALVLIALDPFQFGVSAGIYGTATGKRGASVEIFLGSDEWDAGLVNITMVSGSYVAGTFSAGPNDSSGQPGSISGSFYGFISS